MNYLDRKINEKVYVDVIRYAQEEEGALKF